MTGLDARFARKFDQLVRLLERAGLRVTITSTYRTRQQQERLYDLSQSGVIGRAARPGRSCHEYGAAADILVKPADWALVGRLCATVGLSQPFPSDDPGHIQDTALCQELRGAVPAKPQLPFPAGSSRGTLSDPSVTPPRPKGCP